MTTSAYDFAVPRKPKEPPTKLAAWVRLVREDVADMLQDEFADAIKVARPTVSNWETGKYVIEPENIEKILRRFPSAPRPPFGPNVVAVSSEAQPTTMSLMRAVDEWADAAGIKRPTEDDKFFDALVALWNEYRRRTAG